MSCLLLVFGKHVCCHLGYPGYNISSCKAFTFEEKKQLIICVVRVGCIAAHTQVQKFQINHSSAG